MKQQKKKKGRSVQELMGIKTFTKYGLSTNKGELLFYLVSPTNISVLSHTNIEIKIRHLMMVICSNNIRTPTIRSPVPLVDQPQADKPCRKAMNLCSENRSRASEQIKGGDFLWHITANYMIETSFPQGQSSSIFIFTTDAIRKERHGRALKPLPKSCLFPIRPSVEQ